MSGIQAWFEELCETLSKVFDAFEKTVDEIYRLFELHQVKQGDAGRDLLKFRNERPMSISFIGFSAGAAPIWTALGGWEG